MVNLVRFSRHDINISNEKHDKSLYSWIEGLPNIDFSLAKFTTRQQSISLFRGKQEEDSFTKTMQNLIHDKVRNLENYKYNLRESSLSPEEFYEREKQIFEEFLLEVKEMLQTDKVSHNKVYLVVLKSLK